MTIQVSAQLDALPCQQPGRPDRDAYLASLWAEARKPSVTVEWLQQVRDRASIRLQELAFPCMRDEDWRFTDLSPLLQIPFQANTLDASVVPSVEDLALPEATGSRLVFVNGVYAPHLSATNALPSGVFVGQLSELPVAQQTQLGQELPSFPGPDEVFSTLNRTGIADVAVVWVDKNVEVEPIVQLLFISVPTEHPTLVQPRCLVKVERNSQLALVEEHIALGEGVYLSNSVTELWLEENAKVNHTRIQQDSDTAFHIGKTAASQARDSHYTCHAVSFGASLSRHHLEVYQMGEQTETILNGLTMIEGQQVADTHSAIVYSKPYGRSRQMHKCIVDDRAHVVFNGQVVVPQAAQLTDAGQLSRTLLLSPKARVDTKPQLEIVADNVKCSHGATVSQLEAGEVFYLQSRGIDQVAAQKLLIYAFAAELIQQIPVASVQQRLSQFVREHSS